MASGTIDLSSYADFIQQSSDDYGVPVDWIEAVIDQESSGRPNPTPNGPGYGLMQIMPATAAGLGFAGSIPDDLIDPATNIDLGTKLLGQLMASYGDDFEAVYSAYNSGSATKYLTSTQVGTDVSDAEAWLEQVDSEAGAAVSSAVSDVESAAGDVASAISSNPQSSTIIAILIFIAAATILLGDR